MNKTIQDLYEEARNERDFIMKCSNLAICGPAKPMPVCATVACSPANKKEKTMYDSDDYDTDDKLSYLQQRLNHVRYQRDAELSRAYGLTDDARPVNFNEFLERITSGKYTIDEKSKTRSCYSPLDYVRWRDPSVKEDQAGYEKAIKALDDAVADTMDTIVVISDEATRLAALKEFAKTAATIQ